MKLIEQGLARAIAIAFALSPGLALAFNSGSTGADGAFSPTVNAEVQLPPSGVFNYTTVNIPAGVTITYRKNAANTPVVILASGDVTIAGTIDIRGKGAPGVGAAGDGNQGDDGQPGVGGPGAFDGGKGALTASTLTYGGAGLGPGGGGAGYFVAAGDTCINGNGWVAGGGGGGFGATAGQNGRGSVSCGTPAYSYTQPPGGPSYGSSLLLPLIGGSGGGGGGGGPTFDGGGGGGGGGAILVASSGTLSVSGSILADGGAGAAAAGAGVGGTGGGGSGGAIRLMATTISGNGTISAQGGGAGGYTSITTLSYYGASAGASGRIRLEGDTITRTAATSPLATSDVPSTVFVAGLPTLTITSVAGVNAPATPTGNADITLPAGTANPVVVTFATTGVPVGNTVKLTVTPQTGPQTSAISPAISGSTSAGTASVSVNLPIGPSVLQAQTTYTVVAAVGDLLRHYAGNERVERVELTATLGGPSIARLITVTGKTFEVPQALLAVLGV